MQRPGSKQGVTLQTDKTAHELQRPHLLQERSTPCRRHGLRCTHCQFLSMPLQRHCSTLLSAPSMLFIANEAVLVLHVHKLQLSGRHRIACHFALCLPLRSIIFCTTHACHALHMHDQLLCAIVIVAHPTGATADACSAEPRIRSCKPATCDAAKVSCIQSSEPNQCQALRMRLRLLRARAACRLAASSSSDSSPVATLSTTGPPLAAPPPACSSAAACVRSAARAAPASASWRLRAAAVRRASASARILACSSLASFCS